MSTVLLVEDDPDLREAVASALSDSGYDVLYATNGVEALEQLRSNVAPPDLIMLDLMMPVMNGWELHKELKSNPAFASIPIVVMTAHDDHDLEVEAYLRKPVQLSRLLGTVSRFVATRPSP